MGNNARGQWEIASDVEDPAYVSGNWYMMQEGITAVGSVITANALRMVPFRLRQLANIAQIGARITTLAAGGNVQLGIYASNANTLLPSGQVLARTGNLATDTAGLIAGTLFNNSGVAVSSVQVPRGTYWFGLNADGGAGAVAIMLTLATTVTWAGSYIGGATQLVVSPSSGTSIWARTLSATTFGTWPDLTGVTMVDTATNASAIGMFQVAP